MKTAKRIGNIYIEQIENSLDIMLVEDTKALRTILWEFEAEDLLYVLIDYLRKLYNKEIDRIFEQKIKLEKEITQDSEQLEKDKDMSPSYKAYVEGQIERKKKRLQDYDRQQTKLISLIEWFNDVETCLKAKRGEQVE